MRFFSGLLLAGLFVALANMSLSHAKANTHFYQAQNQLATQPGQFPDNSQINIAEQEIVQAIELAPLNANNLDLAGRVKYLQAQYLEGSERSLALQESTDYHQRALTQRRYWPYSHINILYTKSALDEYDSKFSNHFSEAAKLGTDDSEAIKDLVYIGVTEWKKLNAKNKAETIAFIETALKRRLLTERSFRPYLENLGQLHRICAQLTQFEEKRLLCNS